MAGFFDNFGPSQNMTRSQRSSKNRDSEEFGSRSSRSRSSRSQMDDRDGGFTRSGRRSTGRNPGTVTDPEHDGRMHHGDQKVGVRGQPLLSEEEWLASHHVPHPGARGNRNAAGSHNIPSQSMERIREGGRRGGEAHRGMKFKRTDNEGENTGRSSERSSKSSRAMSMSSRASSSGMRTGRGSSRVSQGRQEDFRNDNVRQLDEVRDIANRLQEVLNELAG